MTQNDFLLLLAQRLQTSPRLILAIDGGAASGKTTLAGKIAQEFSSLSPQIIHMDDFFLQPHQRMAERFAKPGGNIDSERFDREVAQKLRGDCEINYRRFDCLKMDFGESFSVKKGGMIIIEGVYSHLPSFCKAYDLKIFLEASPHCQHARIFARSGAEKLERFKTEWLPLEAAYFKEFEIKQNADILIENK